jgi:hydrophobe/amphiphile efflux-1 (HAE1) family protein
VVEAEIIDPIEQSLLAVEGIEEMRASVRQGNGSITLNFDIDRNVDIALQEVQTAISQVRLPETVDAPTVRKRNPEESPIMFVSITTERSLRETLVWADNYLLDQFRFIPGIGEVDIGGFSTRNLRVWPDLVKLRERDLTITDLLDAIETQHLESAAGQLSNQTKEFRVRWLGEATTAADLGKIRILRRGGQVIQDRVFTIADVALVEDGLTDVRRIARADGKPAVSFAVRKQRGGNEVTLAKAVRSRIEELRPNLPEGYELQVNVDFTESTEAVVNTTVEKLIVAAFVTILVCFLFLGSVQAAINILFSIPTSIVGTFIVLCFAGFTLNLFTLLALTLAVSIVVDDAIMLLENIVRHHRMGKSPHQAAYDGAMEILPAATAATIAVVAVFLPVVFMSGITGKFFFQFGIAMSVAVLLSLLEAVTITPMRSALFLSGSPKHSRFEDFLERRFTALATLYQRVLGVTLRFSWSVLLLSGAVFGVSLLLLNELKREFVPAQDQNFIAVTAQAPTGTAIEATFAKALEIETVLRAEPAIRRFLISIGGGGGVSSVNSIFIPIFLHPREERTRTHLQIMADLRKALASVKGVRISLRDNSTRGLTSGRQELLSFNLRGPSLEVLANGSKELMKRLKAEGMVSDLDTDFKEGLPEFLILPNREAMARRGVSIESVARTLSATIAGIRQNQITSDGRRYDIRIKLPEEVMRNPADVEAIEVRNNFGLRVPLSELVTYEERETYQAINRLNRQRSIGIFGNPAPGRSQGEALARAEQIAKEIFPEGYAFSLEGSSAGLSESFQSLGVALLLGIVVAYMVLAVQFNSFVHPLAVLAALPFSISGALLMLWYFGELLNLFSFIGVIVLMGIAKKNSILLVEYTNQVRHAGEKDVVRALLDACPIRLRPILMTSVATVAAALPLIFGDSMGQETRTPMGLAIAGGTVVSTVFTLFVVPCLYRVLSYFESKRIVRLDESAFQEPPASASHSRAA